MELPERRRYEARGFQRSITMGGKNEKSYKSLLFSCIICIISILVLGTNIVISGFDRVIIACFVCITAVLCVNLVAYSTQMKKDKTLKTKEERQNEYI